MKIRNSIKELIPYDSKQLDVEIRLNANETRNYLFKEGISIPFDVSKYPESAAISLRKKLAKKYNLLPSNFIIGNGSTELLELAVKTFSEAGDFLLSFDPSFAMYEIYAKIHGTILVKIPLKEDMSFPMEDLLRVNNEVNPSIIFLCTPNNPTGGYIPKEDIISFLRNTESLVIVDEAYMDFMFEKESVMDLVNEFDNLLVARTFSKAYGLASIRLGYMVGNKELIRTLMKVKLPYSVNGVSTYIGEIALQQEELVSAFLQETINERETLYRNLTELGLEVFPSKGNFIFIKTSIDIQKLLLKKSILIRSFKNGYYRITVGTKDQNKLVVQALREELL